MVNHSKNHSTLIGPHLKSTIFTEFYSDPIVPRRYPSRARRPPRRYTDTGVT